MTPFKRLLRFWPLLILLAGVATFFALGGHRLLTFDELALRYGELEDWRAASPIVAAVIAVAVYALAVAFSIPLGWLMTLTVGLLFGWLWGTVIVLVGATLGATVLFVAASTALGDFFKRRTGSWLEKFRAGFNRDAASYLLFLRLTPVLPFAVLNIVPALLGVSILTFVWTTFVGIVPGTLVYAVAGEGLRGLVGERAAACAADRAPCGEPFSPTELVRPELFIAIGLLALVALLPVVIKRIRLHNTGVSRT